MPGKLYSCGYNDAGNLGTGSLTPSSRSTLTQVGSLTDWSYVSSGRWFSAGIAGGKLFTWGQNSNYNLGTGDTTYHYLPTQIGSETTWTKVAVGNRASAPVSLFAIREGKLYSCGSNMNGNTGQGTTSNFTISLTQVGEMTGWTDIAASIGSNTEGPAVYGICDGKLYAWGQNGEGHRLGVGSTNSTLFYSSPTQVGSFDDWEAVYAIGDGGFGSACCGFAIRAGKIYSWGSNEYGKTGQGTISGTTPSVTQIGSDSNWNSINPSTHVGIAIKNGGELWTWGRGGSGRLGDGTTGIDTATPARIATQFDDWQWARGFSVFAVAFRNGKLYSWGEGSLGWLGQGNTNNYLVPTQIPGNETWIDAGSGGGGNGVALFAIEQAAVAPSNTAAPTVSGVAKVGQTLTTTDGTWTSEEPLTYTYQWQVYADGIWNDISGATASTYLLTLAEAGKLVRAQVTATNTAGSITASSSSVGIVVMAIPDEGLVWHSARTNLSTSSEGLIFWPRIED